MTIQYGLASVWERAIAWMFDLVLMGLTSLIIWGLQVLIIPRDGELALYFGILPLIVLYSLLFELLNNGQSFGKKILKLRVIRMDGEKAGFYDYFMRWIFRALDIYGSLGGVAVLGIISSTYSQRLGDLLANTVVVHVGKNERMPLENLLRLNRIENYKVSYPQVIKMPEEAMLIVKETITKYKTLDNDAHTEAFEQLVKKMEKELNIKAPADREAFLKTLLKDYIILTR